MKLIKDNVIIEQKDEFIIGIFKENGWEEVKGKEVIAKEEPKQEPKAEPKVEPIKNKKNKK